PRACALGIGAPTLHRVQYNQRDEGENRRQCETRRALPRAESRRRRAFSRPGAEGARHQSRYPLDEKRGSAAWAGVNLVVEWRGMDGSCARIPAREAAFSRSRACYATALHRVNAPALNRAVLNRADARKAEGRVLQPPARAEAA